jgi:phage terminase small subunit
MPAKVRKLRGNLRQHNSNYVKVIPGIPNPPTRLSGKALREWNRILPLLEPLGILSQLDRAALTRYCCAHARWDELDQQIQDDPDLFAGWTPPCWPRTLRRNWRLLRTPAYE